MSSEPSRNDFVPVLLSGDTATYPMMREFHEAFGVVSYCLVPEPIKIIEYSSIVHVVQVDNMEFDTIAAAISELAGKHASQKLVVIANSDGMIEKVARLEGRVPKNVICACAPLEVMLQASDKIEFARMCSRFGLDTPQTEVVDLAGTDPIAPSSIEFPVCVKPATSSEYTYLQFQGFQKVYFFQNQEELNELWHRLREVGFLGKFLVQELIEGGDTYIDSITMYINREGVATLASGAQVLLEDHSPALYGNPVSMITRPMPELWEKVERMLVSIGWHGFANFDLKRDPKTGRTLFMDFNPRIGANSYYSCAAGINPMKVLIDDVIDGVGERACVERAIVHSRVPAGLTRKYIEDTALLAEYDAIVHSGNIFNPIRYPKDSVRTRTVAWIMEHNYLRKFAKYYPEPTGQAF